jgi:hypothetical protein
LTSYIFNSIIYTVIRGVRILKKRGKTKELGDEERIVLGPDFDGVHWVYVLWYWYGGCGRMARL